MKLFNLTEFCRRLRRQHLPVLALMLAGPAGGAGVAQEPPKPDPASAGLLWQEQMHTAWDAFNQKNYARAEQSCREALNTAGQMTPPDGRVATNLVFLAEICQSENKSDLTGQYLQAAVASGEKVFGPAGAALVMPLEKLANYYYFAQQRYDLAAPICLRILRIVEQATPPDNAEIIKRARAVAAVYRVQSQFASAEPFYRQTLALAAKNGADYPECLLTVAGFYHEWGKNDQAEALCEEALAIRQKAVAASPGVDSEMNLAISLYGLAEIYRSWGRLSAAEDDYRQSVAIVEKASGAESSELARPLSGLAAALAEQGETNQAAALYQRAFSVTESNLPAGDPVAEDVLHGYTGLLEQMNRSAEAATLRQNYQWRALMYGSARALRLNNLTEAERLTDEALDLARGLATNDARRVRSQVQLAEVRRQQGKGDLAEQAYQDAIASCEKADGPASPELIFPLQSLANFYYYTRVRYDQVTVLYQRILKIIQAGPAPDPLEVARWERNLAEVCRLQKQNDRAEDYYRQALAAAESATNAPAGETVQYLQALGDIYRVDGRFAQAEPVLKRALAIREQAPGAGSAPDAELDVAVCCDYLAQNYLAWHRPDLAEGFARRALAIGEKIAGPDSPDLSARLLALAAALQAEKKYADAQTQYQRALAVTQKAAGPYAAQLADILEPYAALLADMKKTGEAQDMRDWAVSVRKENETQN